MLGKIKTLFRDEYRIVQVGDRFWLQKRLEFSDWWCVKDVFVTEKLARLYVEVSNIARPVKHTVWKELIITNSTKS